MGIWLWCKLSLIFSVVVHARDVGASSYFHFCLTAWLWMSLKYFLKQYVYPLCQQSPTATRADLCHEDNMWRRGVFWDLVIRCGFSRSVSWGCAFLSTSSVGQPFFPSLSFLLWLDHPQHNFKALIPVASLFCTERWQGFRKELNEERWP